MNGKFFIPYLRKKLRGSLNNSIILVFGFVTHNILEWTTPPQAEGVSGKDFSLKAVASVTLDLNGNIFLCR